MKTDEDRIDKGERAGCHEGGEEQIKEKGLDVTRVAGGNR